MTDSVPLPGPIMDGSPSPHQPEGGLIPPWFVWPRDVTIHLVSTNIHRRDGIGNFVIALYELWQQQGIRCQLYGAGYAPDLAGLVQPLEHVSAAVAPMDIVVVHFSIYLPQLEQIAALDCHKILYFHGITDPQLLAGFDPNLADQCQKGYEQGPLMGHFDHIAVNSRASGAIAQSFVDPSIPIAVIPPVLNLSKWRAIAATPLPLPTPGRTLLYVGRVVPHKKIEDLICLYHEYYALDPDSCLLIAGSNDFGTYNVALQSLLQEQPPAVRARIHILGAVSDEQLKALYQRADAFWLMSEHEGFCIPLVEAMGFDLPVFAFALPAVRETLGEAGMVFYQKDMAQIAQVVHQTLFNEHQRHYQLAVQTQRLQQLLQASNGRTIWHLLESCLEHLYASPV